MSISRRLAPRVNITPQERIGRIVVGLVGAVGGVVLLTSASSAVSVVLEILLVLAGLDLLVTGATGHCPLYARLGHVPSSLDRRAGERTL
ncbi:YgaP-like transmembrane domain [Cellulomonas hominis]